MNMRRQLLILCFAAVNVCSQTVWAQQANGSGADAGTAASPGGSQDSSKRSVLPTISNVGHGSASSGSTVQSGRPANGVRPTLVNQDAAGVLKDSEAANRPAQSAPAQPLSDAEPQNEFQEFVGASLGRLLPMFGYELFKSAPSTFAPVDRVPITPDYVIGPGDEVVIRAWGQVDIDYRATVDRTGAIHIPQIGSLIVGGLRYQDLHGYMRTAIGRVFKNFDLNVSLGQLRSIQIFVVGQARRPGAYTVSSLSTLVNALFASGGPSSRGSMRSIQLKRGERVVSEFDVYELLLKGDKSKDARLLPGDVLYIPPIGERVAISGSVNVPAIYELKNGTSVQDLINLAGGLSTTAAGQKIKVERIADRRSRYVDEFNFDREGLARQLRDGDLVQIYALSPKFENAVTIRGAVTNSGRFPWHQGMTIRDLIPNKEALIMPEYWQRLNRTSRTEQRASAQRPTEQRSPGERGAERQAADSRPAGEPRLGDPAGAEQRSRLDMKRLFDEINWDYAVVERLNPADLTIMLVPFNLERAVVGEPTQNLALQPGDIVTIFSRTDVQVPVAKQSQFVRLEGEVRTPGIYQLLPGETLRQVVARVGGLTPSAFLYASEMTRESLRIQQQKRLDEATERMSQEVERSAAGRAQAAMDDKENVQAQVETQRRLIARLRELRATGRIVMELPPERTEVRDLPELTLEDGDRFFVPSRPSTVGVIGSVYNQTSFIYEPGKRVTDYLQLAGGLTPGADKGRTYVVRADGSVTGRAQSSFFNVLPSEKLNPGDTVVVPENLERFHLSKQLRDWTQILSQFALGAAAVKILRQ
jgi:polysaccharide export outer membrane protein